MLSEELKKPRRRVTLKLAAEADNWQEMQFVLKNLTIDIARNGSLSTSYVSGGYSSGFILSSSEDTSITHESWQADLEAYLNALDARKETPDAANR